MKRIKILIYLTLFSLLSCTSFKVNLAFKMLGLYDDNVELSKFTNGEKEVVFFPMHHLGTKLFYDDVKTKIDSLKKIGYFFYTEEVKGIKNDSTTLRKSIKLTGIPFSRNNAGYRHYFDSIYKGKVKFKKEIFDQPSPGKLALDGSNTKTVDVTLKEMIDYYESKYGEIKLEPCDFEKSLYEKTNCKYKPMEKKVREDLYIGFRNKNILKTFFNDSHKKIAFIYGADHLIGIREELLKQGFK
ncbi:hypothetical protein QWY90_14820 [Flavobacterium paronense]|uniref:Lipoprotein n=1 Tax=Flavobacterium paronense TaxID=1392775 RepID=A0ABV5GF72_9FLAO|nr:hypothetical protein [Flavobacterium paronense]MDN3678586.1 hypothetical protein [Flavobacterium paronense]